MLSQRSKWISSRYIGLVETYHPFTGLDVSKSSLMVVVSTHMLEISMLNGLSSPGKISSFLGWIVPFGTIKDFGSGVKKAGKSLYAAYAAMPMTGKRATQSKKEFMIFTSSISRSRVPRLTAHECAHARLS